MAEPEKHSETVATQKAPDGTVTTVAAKTVDNSDAFAGFVAKVIVGYFTGPKMAAVLAAQGISVDPALATIVVTGMLHKIHTIVKQKTNIDWL